MRLIGDLKDRSRLEIDLHVKNKITDFGKIGLGFESQPGACTRVGPYYPNLSQNLGKRDMTEVMLAQLSSGLTSLTSDVEEPGPYTDNKWAIGP